MASANGIPVLRTDVAEPAGRPDALDAVPGIGAQRLRLFERFTDVGKPAIENHIRKNETFKIPSTIQTSRNLGMFLLDDHIWELYGQGAIDKDELLMKCQNPRQMREKLGIQEST